MSTSIWCIGRISTRRSRRRCGPSTTSCAQGKVRYIGVSNFRLSQLEACMKLRRIDVVQYGWNMFDRRMQREIFPWCTANGVGVMAYGSLAYGLLSGTFHDGHGVRRDRLAVEARRAGQPQPVPHHVRSGSFRAQPARGRGSQGAGGQVRQDAAAIRAALDAQPACRRTPGWSASAARPRWRKTSARSAVTISAGDMAEIDAIFARHDVVTEPPGWLEDDPPA